MVASSSLSSHNWSYDVFLSFRGEDTRSNFTSYLYRALCAKRINTFHDTMLQAGDEISPKILKAIEMSRISLVVFSPDYVSSTFCLDELDKIIETKKSKGQIVIPIFYNVNSADVWEAKGRYGELLAELKDRFEDDKVQKWRLALTEVPKTSGFDLSGGDEPTFVDDIVEKVSKILEAQDPQHFNALVRGRSSGVKLPPDIETKLSLDSPDIRLMGTLDHGKTLKLSQIFSMLERQLRKCFDYNSHFINLRNLSNRYNVSRLEETVLFEKCGRESILVGTFDQGIDHIIKERYFNKKALIVIEDVDHIDQLKKLSEVQDWLGVGSRIIITTKDESLLSHLEWRLDLTSFKEECYGSNSRETKLEQEQQHCKDEEWVSRSKRARHEGQCI